MQLNSYLVKSRHAIYYLRLRRNWHDKHISSRTRDLETAALAEYRLGVIMSSDLLKEALNFLGNHPSGKPFEVKT